MAAEKRVTLKGPLWPADVKTHDGCYYLQDDNGLIEARERHVEELKAQHRYTDVAPQPAEPAPDVAASPDVAPGSGGAVDLAPEPASSAPDTRLTRKATKDATATDQTPPTDQAAPVPDTAGG